MWKTDVPVGQVTAKMRSLFGRLARWRQLAEGENSQAFAFRAGGRELVVRVNKRRFGFDKDAWAAVAMADTGVSVPEVVDIGLLDGGEYYCVTTRIAGERFDRCPPHVVRNLSSAVASTLRDIVGFDMSGTTGFGDIDPASGQGRHTSWSSAVTDGVPTLWRRDQDGIDFDLADEVTAIAVTAAATLPDVRKLVHGDFNPDNLIVADGTIAGVLDWDCAMIGDPLWDVAYVLFWAASRPVMVAQAEYLAAGLPDSPELRDRLRCYLLLIGLRSMRFFLRSGLIDSARLMPSRMSALRAEPVPIDRLDGYWLRLDR